MRVRRPEKESEEAVFLGLCKVIEVTQRPKHSLVFPITV